MPVSWRENEDGSFYALDNGVGITVKPIAAKVYKIRLYTDGWTTLLATHEIKAASPEKAKARAIALRQKEYYT